MPQAAEPSAPEPLLAADVPTPPHTVNLHRALGLTDAEAEAIDGILGRPANPVELAMYSVMWSEHCSYKSSRSLLGRLPTEAPWVIVGPGENAGVIDVGHGIAVALRIESHNHPSAIEPTQGAATGVGGILRDIFTMGARPIALLDSLHFGLPNEPRNRWLIAGVVSGVSGYGNAVGVPTVGGEVGLRTCFAENPLVNVMCVGVLARDNLVLGAATEEGTLAVLLGSATGRDGIGGVSVLASAGLAGSGAATGTSKTATGDDASKRPSVQVGDPFEEKRLIEACLALFEAGLVTGIQDLGGAGLTCATSETASRGGMGMDVDVSAVPLRESAMTPAEVMTSESQERMLAIVRPADLEAVLAICRRWEVRASVLGKVTKGGRLRLTLGPDGPVVADVPARSLHDDAPRYDRDRRAPADLDSRRGDSAARLPAPEDCGGGLLSMLCDTSWVWSQYDHQLFLNTVVGPGAGAAVLRLKAPGLKTEAGTNSKAIALTTDSNSRWCALDPRAGTALVAAEAVLNVACTGARPLAVVNCLNFGNPEHPEVMWQLSEAIDGLSEACLGLGVPVVGGNVSLYNESAGRDIDPTPVIGLLGLIDHLDRRPPGLGLSEGSTVMILGQDPEARLDGSRWAEMTHGHRGGTLPSIDYRQHLALSALVVALVTNDLLNAITDITDGGLGVALAEMAVASGVGLRAGNITSHAQLFSEAPSRVVVGVEATNLDEVERRCRVAGVTCQQLGIAGGDRLAAEGLFDLSVAQMKSAWQSAMKRWLDTSVR